MPDRGVGAGTRARWAVEASAVSAAEWLARLVPQSAIPPAGSVLGWVAYALDRRHRRVALDNVRQAYGSTTSAAAQRQLVRRCYGHFGRVGLEVLRFGRLTAHASSRLADYEGVEHLRTACLRGRGVLICAAHFGNWELHALCQGWIGFPVALVTRPMDNPAIERQLARLRTRSGNTLIGKRQSFATVLQTLRRGGTVGILVDQRPRTAGIQVPFFGRPARTSLAPALLALRAGSAVVPAFSVPRPDGSYRLVYEAEIPVRRSGDVSADARQLTALYTARVEGWVRQHPESWFWMHNRWKG
jgi:KDO2-lipid IV(A) lauroyltransferase